MFAIGFEMFCAECDVNNEAKILRIEIVFATLKPAVKNETVECKLH